MYFRQTDIRLVLLLNVHIQILGDLDELGILYPTVGYSNEKIYIYLGRGLSKTDAHLDDGEFLSVKKMPFHDAYAMAIDGSIKDSKTVVALLKYAAVYKK